MKSLFTRLAFCSAVALLGACGGDQLLESEDDVDHLLPEPDTGVPDDRPRPPEDAPTLTTNESQILDIDGEPVLLRGINLQYGDNPTLRYDGIGAIRETGSNVVRIQLREDSTIDEVEAALNKAVDEGLIAMVMLRDENITCQNDADYLIERTDELWLDRWLPALAQRRFQDHLMINIANEWGPMNVFDAFSFGYDSYIDTYKVLIRKFRDAGFKVPLVIDAPHCGQDYSAFLAARGRELMAADEEDNLVLSVHAYRGRWNANDEIIRAMDLLSQENVPVVVGEFGGSNVWGEEESINHNELMRIGAGEKALVFDLPWMQTDDKAAYKTTLDESYNLNNASVSVDVYIDQHYVDDGQLALVMYIKDTQHRYANLGWNQVNGMTGNSWNTIRVSLSDTASIPGWVADGFDLSMVNQIGFEIVANGKAVDVTAPIEFDNLKITKGEVSGPMYDEDFNVDTAGWGGGWGSAELSQADSNLVITPDWTAGDNFAKTLTGAGVIDFTQDLTITARVFLPAEYVSEAELYFKFFGQFGEGWTWVQSADKRLTDFTVGEWTDIVFNVNYSDPPEDEETGADVSLVQAFGMQWGGVTTAKTESILIDRITIEGPQPEVPPVTQYIATFDEDTESWNNLGWGAGATIAAVDGVLSVDPDWSESDNIALGRSGIATVDTIDLSTATTLKAKIFMPASYGGSELWFKFFLQDGSEWIWAETETLGSGDFVAGDWAEIELALEFPDNFATNLRPNALGMQFGGVPAGTGAFLFDDIEIQGVGEPEAETLLQIDFAEESEALSFVFDFGEGSFDESSTIDARIWGYGTPPFGWIAWSWIGNGEETAVLDMSTSEDSVVLTERGVEIVEGEFGIEATSHDPNFLPVEAVETR